MSIFENILLGVGCVGLIAIIICALYWFVAERRDLWQNEYVRPPKVMRDSWLDGGQHLQPWN
jgi:hypothetical protein